MNQAGTPAARLERRGCRLDSFRIEHPDAYRPGGSLEELAISTGVARADVVRLVATVRTPNGAVESS